MSGTQMADKIKAIETVYRNRRFRSRLEARWAIFFDTLGIEWMYEKEGYDVAGEWYLPDFWMPYTVPGVLEQGWGEFVEIKPTPLTDDDVEFFAKFTRLVGHRVFVFCGEPDPERHSIYCFQHHHGGEPERVPLFSDGTFAVSRIWFDGVPPEETLQIRSLTGQSRYSFDIARYPASAARWADAVKRSMSARFEHGEKP